jgi:PAS domain S-box-containing protein
MTQVRTVSRRERRGIADLIALLLTLPQQIKLAIQARQIVRSRDLLRETLDALPVGVELYDRNERLTLFNKAAGEMSDGILHAGSIGKTFSELAREFEDGERAAGIEQPLSAAARIARFRSKGHLQTRRSMEGRWIERFELPTASGGTIALRRDITELKNRELEIERGRDFLQETINALPAGVTVYDQHERLIMFNAEAHGLNPRIQVGKTYPELLAEMGEDAEAAGIQRRRVERDLRRFRSKGERDVVQMADGRWFEWSEKATPSGLTVGLRINVNDLKLREQELERSRAEYQSLLERLEQEMERFRSIVESSGALIVLVDRDLDVIMANREFWKSTGLDPDKTIGRSFNDVLDSGLDPEVLKRWLSGPLSVEQTKPVRYSKRRLDADGRERFINITAKPIVDEGRITQQIVFLGVDDTERREAERALVETERLTTLGEMAATVAHEIAQPLQVIDLSGASAIDEINEARMSGRQPDVDYIVSKLERSSEQVEKASRIMNELRAFVRNTASDKAARFDPGQALNAAVELTRHAMRLGGVDVRIRTDGELPPVNGHIGKFEQVLVNLLNNARDEGATVVELVAGRIRRDARELLRVAVEDNGPGIAPHILPKLFQAFVTTKPRGKGTGLGLRICRRIIEEMRGSIGAANRPGGGACFEILLPLDS